MSLHNSHDSVVLELSEPGYAPRRITIRVPEACHGPAGASDHHHEVPVKAALVPKELYEHIVEAGVVKSRWRLDRHIVMGLLAGFYIGFSFTVCMVIGGQIPQLQAQAPGLQTLVYAAFGFPLGLFMIVVLGADLWTSNCAYMMVALHEGRCTLWDVIKSWTLSWFVNLAGSIIMAQIVGAAEIFEGRDTFTLHLVEHKASYTFGACLCKALLANWLVNLAVWIANAAQDITGKAVGIFLPIMAFIAIGGEHCIANQFLFTLAKYHGSELSTGYFIAHNLIPATIGNLIGGAFFVGTLHSLAVGDLFDTTYANIGHMCRGDWSKVFGTWWRPLPPTLMAHLSAAAQRRHHQGADVCIEDVTEKKKQQQHPTLGGAAGYQAYSGSQIIYMGAPTHTGCLPIAPHGMQLVAVPIGTCIRGAGSHSQGGLLGIQQGKAAHLAQPAGKPLTGHALLTSMESAHDGSGQAPHAQQQANQQQQQQQEAEPGSGLGHIHNGAGH